jgi:hypothetical protein
MKMRSCNFCHTNTKNPENNLGIFCLITGRPKLNGYCHPFLPPKLGDLLFAYAFIHGIALDEVLLQHAVCPTSNIYR